MLSLYFFLRKKITKDYYELFVYLNLWPLCHFDQPMSFFYFFSRGIEASRLRIVQKMQESFLTKFRDFQGKYCLKETSDPFSINRLKIPECKFKVMLKILIFYRLRFKWSSDIILFVQQGKNSTFRQKLKGYILNCHKKSH